MNPAPLPRVLVLRPAPGNAETIARLATCGVAAEPLPLFAIEPLAWQPPSVGRFDALLLTSANAVRHGGRGLAGLAGLPAWCVGESTAAAARAAGFEIARVGTGGVTALVEGGTERLLWLCGEDRTALDDADEARVTAVPVYRSCTLPIVAAALVGPCIAMLHSARAATRLAELAEDRSATAIVAISPAAAEAAGEGWRAVAVATQPSDAQMVALVAKLCQNSVSTARSRDADWGEQGRADDR